MKLITEQDILELISNQIEESIHLDFKRGDGLINNRDCKKELAKDVSAFANSDGGIIIYGIEENNHIASSIVAVDGNSITKEWLEQVINTNINRRISDIIITPIRMQGNIASTVYVVNIPRSLDSPHMTSEKRFYKRFNFESVPMEEYEIRDLYNRANFVNLEISEIIVESGGERWSTNPSYHDRTSTRLQGVEFHLGFQIKNVGRSIEINYKLEVETDLYFHSSHEPYNPIQKHFIRKEGINSIYSIPNTSPIFQNEKTTIIRAAFTLNSDTFMNYAYHIIKCKLYYSNGMKEKQFIIRDLIEFKGKKFLDIFK